MNEVHTTYLYIEDRAYGGPEEGGWWYGTVDPVPLDEMYELGFEMITSRDLEVHRDYCDRMRQKVEDLNEGRYDISSVLSTGRYALYTEEGMPRSHPEEIPYYS